MRTFKRLVLLALASPFMVSNASAMTVTFELADFLISSSTTSSVNLFADPIYAPALPADATFTLPPNPTNTYLTANQGKFLRYSFDLPAGFYDLAFTFEA